MEKEIYIIQEWGRWGITEMFYFLDLEKAKKHFKKVILEEKKKCRADKSLAKQYITTNQYLLCGIIEANTAG